MDDTSGDGQLPSVVVTLKGILDRELTLQYLRWLRTSLEREIILGIALWIAGDISVTPSQDILNRYSDRSHTMYYDR